MNLWTDPGDLKGENCLMLTQAPPERTGTNWARKENMEADGTNWLWRAKFTQTISHLHWIHQDVLRHYGRCCAMFSVLVQWHSVCFEGIAWNFATSACDWAEAESSKSQYLCSTIPKGVEWRNGWKLTSIHCSFFVVISDPALRSTIFEPGRSV